MMKLFHVITTVPEFRGHRDVQLWWFVNHRVKLEERPCSELIEGYELTLEPDWRGPSPEEAIDELFSEAEAAAFVAWLKQNRNETDETTKLREAGLPLSVNNVGLNAIPCGGGIDNLGLRDFDEATLGFSVYGFYDLRAHDRIEESNRAEK